MENSQTEQKIEKKTRKEKAGTKSKYHTRGVETHQIVPVVSDYFDFIREDQSCLFDNLSIGYVSLDGKGVIKNSNPAAVEMLGIKKKYLINTDFNKFVFKEDQKYFKFDEACLFEPASPHFDIRLKKKQGMFWARASVSIGETSHGMTRQINLTFCDITDLKQDEQEKIELKHQLQQTQKMEAIGVLSSGIVHDFNNILHPIIGSLEILIEDAGCDKKLQKTLKNILTGANRAGNLVRQILSFSHQADTEVGPVKIQPIIKEVLKLTRSTLPANIKIVRTIDNDCGPVMADPTHIYQIAMNLITNAFHAMGHNDGTLDVTLKKIKIIRDTPYGLTLTSGSYVCLSVADTGGGIKKSIINNIFEPYFTTKEEGTGLGLSIISEIVKKYGGDICCSSEPGKGSLFRVYLPMDSVPFETRQNCNDKGKDLFGNESILFVDDDPFIVEVQKETFERCGYTVTPFVNSLAALDEFKTRPGIFDIVICDMAMPGMTGLALAESIKLIRPDIPVIICTGFSEQINQDSYLDKGIDGFLTKPAVKEESLELIRHLLGSR